MGRPRRGEETIHQTRAISRANKPAVKQITIHEIDFNSIDMSRNDVMWTDQMTRSIFSNPGNPNKNSKIIRESLRF